MIKKNVEFREVAMKKEKKQKAAAEAVQSQLLEKGEASAKEGELSGETEAALEEDEEKPPAFSEDYEALREKLNALEAETARMAKELERLKDRKKGLWRAWVYRDFQRSPLLRELTGVYMEMEGKEEQYRMLSACVREQRKRGGAEFLEGLQAQLAADRERYGEENLSNLAGACGILSAAGVIAVLAGHGGGVLIFLFLVLGGILAGLYMKSVKNAECRAYIAYMLEVCRAAEKGGEK